MGGLPCRWAFSTRLRIIRRISIGSPRTITGIPSTQQWSYRAHSSAASAAKSISSRTSSCSVASRRACEKYFVHELVELSDISLKLQFAFGSRLNELKTEPYAGSAGGYFTFPAARQSDPRSSIDIASITFPRSPVSLSLRDEVPHIFTRKSRLRHGEFLIIGAKRLLQQNRMSSGLKQGLASRVCRERELLCLDIRGLDHLSPLLGFVGDKCSERGGRHRHRLNT